MKAFRPLYREAAIVFYRWALAEIHPMHDDVPAIVLRLRQLLNERHAQPCLLRRTLEWL